MSPSSSFNPPPFDAQAPTETPSVVETPVASTPVVQAPEAPVYLPGAPLQTPAPQAPVEIMAPEPARAHAATNPLLAMLIGALLSCALLGGGILIGRGGVGGVAPVGETPVDPARDPIVSAVKIIGPAVMNVDTTFGAPAKDKNFLPAPGSENAPPEGGQGKGTGFIIDSKRGLMLTNAHVVAGAKKVQVTTPDGRKINGHVRGYDRQSDIAVVVVDDKTLPQAKLAAFKNPKELDIGQQTIAIGNPFGQENTVTKGVLSAVGRTLPVPPDAGRDAFELTDMMQTDTPINPGNSGGPLCNAKGEVLGINTAIIPFGQGLGFTIPINKAKKVADQIIKDGKVLHPYVGVLVKPINDGLQADLGLPDKKGGLVQAVEPNSPAAKGGLKIGDVIRQIDGKPVKDDKEIVAEIQKAKIGQNIKIEVFRNGTNKQTLNLKVADRPQL